MTVVWDRVELGKGMHCSTKIRTRVHINYPWYKIKKGMITTRNWKKERQTNNEEQQTTGIPKE